MALFCGIHEKYAMWKLIVDVVHDFVSSLQPDVGRGFLHISNVFLFILGPHVSTWGIANLIYCPLDHHWGINFREISIKIQNFSFKKMYLKIVFENVCHFAQASNS